MKTFKNLKLWASVAKPNWVLVFFQFLTAVIPSICAIIAAVPAAKAITAITVADYKWAMIYLAIAFAFDALGIISWEIEYRLDAAQLRGIYPRIQERLFSKIYSADDANFKYTSKEKMVNIITNNIVTLSDFCDYLAYKSAYLVEAIITLVIIFSTNFYIGILIFGIAIVVYFLITALNAAIGRRSMSIQAERDNLTESFADMVDGRHLATDLNLKKEQHEQYFNKVSSLMTHYSKRKNLRSIRDNWVYLLYTGIILIAQIYLITLVRADTLTATLYLVITPYLTSAITKFVDFFSVSTNLEDANIAALRVKTLLDMSEKDMVEFGKNSTDKIEGAITFSNVSYSSKGKIDTSLGDIKLMNLQIAKNQVVLFEGLRNCGKRAIFYMLRRAVRPDEGTITFDTINIYDFNIDTYKHNIAYATNKPFFFNASIMENLKLVEGSKKKIIDTCKTLGIDEKISALPEGYDTNLVKNPTALNDQAKFLLGLARAILTKSEIFMIYEFPIGLNEQEQATIRDILSKLSKNRTILVFSAQNPIDSIIDRHFKITSGNIEELPVQKNKRIRRPKGPVENSSANSRRWS